MTVSSPPLTSERRTRGGLLLVGILLIGANLRAAITPVGPVLGFIQHDHGISAALASVLISIPLVAFALVSPIAPIIARRFGMERALGGSLALLALAIVIRSLPWSAGLWIGTVLLGIAIAIINVVLPSLIKRDFPDRVGSVTGWYSAVQGTAAAIASGLAVPIAGSDGSGWRLALGIWAGLALIALAVFWPQLRSRTLPNHDRAAALDPHPERYRSPWKSALAWQVTAYMGLQSTVFYSIITWLPSIERSAGIDPTTAGFHQSELQLVGVLATITAAALVQRTRSQSLLALGAALFSAAGIIGVLFNPSLAVLWAALLGAAGGASIVIVLSMFGLRTSHHGQAAALSGMAQSIGYLFAAFGPIVIGLIHDATGNWQVPLLVLLGVVVAQAIFGMLSGRNRVVGLHEPAASA
ncbi:MFS transporter [Mycetocola tolaasinivorans]|uniref:MFS transporter n=1 Tax=Mycetocola tolaasinivorans TaxID=76635 RepID=A0A3L7AB40_9MICO|nr:MFS transporter [Mycetocola tolaasinivorans]RLP77543.1 MFS transporter [Mycetocola tolaasinivorans]